MIAGPLLARHRPVASGGRAAFADVQATTIEHPFASANRSLVSLLQVSASRML
jgi:hypothetical protein